VLFQIPNKARHIHSVRYPTIAGVRSDSGITRRSERNRITFHGVEEKVDVGGVVRSALIPIEPLTIWRAWR